MDWTEKKNGQSGGTVVALESDRQGSLGLDRAVWVQTWRWAGVCAFRDDGQRECAPLDMTVSGNVCLEALGDYRRPQAQCQTQRPGENKELVVGRSDKQDMGSG